jgi:hypothetical protein
LGAAVDGSNKAWSERRLFIRSLQMAKAVETVLQELLANAPVILEALKVVCLQNPNWARFLLEYCSPIRYSYHS